MEMSHCGAGRGRRGARIYGRARVLNANFCTSMCEGRQKTAMEEDGNQTNVERERTALTETDEMETKSLGSKPLLSQE